MDNVERFYDASSHYLIPTRQDQENINDEEEILQSDDRLVIDDGNISMEESMFPEQMTLDKKEDNLFNVDTKETKDIIPAKCFEVGFKANQLKELLVMQLDLIGHQQLNIVEKDKQIIMLKSEKEQLQARLSRMERRISVQKRHHTFELASEESSSTLTRSKVASPSLKSPIVTQVTQKKLIENSADNKAVSLAPVTITSCNDKGFCFENFLRTNVAYLDPPFKRLLCNKKEASKTDDNIKKVPVPPWRAIDQDSNAIINEETAIEEDTSDVAYDKRHSKPEQEEKRRKRWDLQQARQQRQHEMLVQRYIDRQKKGSSQGKSGDFSSANKQLKQTSAIDSLSKGSDGIYALDVTEIVPVCAFGYPLPSLTPRELDIPWFNIAKREVQLRNAKQKQVTRSKRKVRSSIVTQRRRYRNNVK